MKPVVESDGLQVAVKERKLLSDVCLKCERGEIIGLLGRNGQGKSCLMNIIYGSLACEKSVRFDQVSIKEPYKKPTLIRYLPQFHYLPNSSCLQRVFKDFELEYDFFIQVFPEFKGKQKVAIGRLSGGQKRLVEIYVIMKSRSLFVMLDEPFTMLNPLQIEKVKSLLIEEKSSKGILVTDHLYRHILDLSDSIYILSNGRTHLTKNSIDLERMGYVNIS
ncbi:MAG: ATP-binding cassette domain-containing protein [Chitinophagaceae bacterium]|nr:ATP-binding cassette domain-containing protein [Chitinophagaceae bacterium]